MGIWHASDAAGKVIKEKREMGKMMEDKKQEAKDEAAQQEVQHEENKKQGML